ncbi:recombinase family protein [Novosphingobium sp.]|uniref:recombinase family protein n=1 Tax=Novosphingobium sp. TaxID=1874826 RepID=UPI002FDA5DCC
MSKNAILYLRVSTPDQVKGTGMDRQHRGGLAYIAEQRWHLSDTISDAGRSAFHGINRLQGSALHKFEIEARDGQHEGKVLVVENLDRLSRQGPKALTKLIWSLNEYGVDVAVWQTNKIFSADNGDDILGMFEAILVGSRGKEESLTKSLRGKELWVKRYANIENGTMGTMAGQPPEPTRRPPRVCQTSH